MKIPTSRKPRDVGHPPSYTYDAAGNRLSKTDQASQVTSNYAYDAIYQLLQVTQGATTTESYSYDLVGNRLSSLGVSPYVYNSSNQLTSTPTATYTYDNNGSTKTKVDASGTTTYNWDYENRLSSVVLPEGGGTVSFKYDPFGRRIQKSGPSGAANYLYDGNDLIEETDNSGSVLAKYTGENEIDEPLAEFRSGTPSYYEQDGQGSISSLSNAGGALANTYTYDSYGKLTASTGTLTNPFQYTAREFDSETQLYFNRARYRDPATGRWLSEDPIGFLGGHDFYSYVVNNPLKYRDPMGWQSQMPSCYPDCVHTQEEIQNMEREHEATMERIFPPSPPGPPPAPNTDCKCKNKKFEVRELTTTEQLESLATMTQIIEAAGDVGLGVGLQVGGVAGTVYLCVQTGGLGCVLGVEAAPAYIIGGYELTKGGLNELDEIFNEEDCK
jgi:RHS repeat-associated protein